MAGYNESARLIDLLGLTYDNFGEPIPWSNRKDTLLGLTITFLILSWISVVFRLYVRYKVVKSGGLDDVFVILYLLCGTVASVAFILSIDFGTGQHFLLLTVGQVGRYLVTFYMFNVTANMSAAFIKLSLLFQYLRIFDGPSRTRNVTILVIVLVSLWGMAFTALALVPCMPVSDFWYSPPNAKCWGYGSSDPKTFTATFETHGTLNMVFDLIVLAIPVSLYFKREMENKERAGLLALLFMGALVNFLGIWRLQTIIAHQAGYWPTHDPTWYGPISLILAVLEINCASICASVPIFWPVVAPFLGYIFVTNEVIVERHEFNTLSDDKTGLGMGSNPTCVHPRQSQGSETSLHRHRPSQQEVKAKFDEDYIMGQVDPLRGTASVQSRVRSESIKRKRASVISWFTSHNS